MQERWEISSSKHAMDELDKLCFPHKYSEKEIERKPAKVLKDPLTGFFRIEGVSPDWIGVKPPRGTTGLPMGVLVTLFLGMILGLAEALFIFYGGSFFVNY